MVVVPAFAERQHGHPPAVAGIITGSEPGLAPQMRSGIDQPGRMQSQRQSQKNSPEQHGPATEAKEN